MADFIINTDDNVYIPAEDSYLLCENDNLDLTTVYLLDQVQKGKRISKAGSNAMQHIMTKQPCSAIIIPNETACF